ncbi:MAG: hypothetical protein L7V86_14685 [Verrucomicrobiales bacterium]|nr:hypothetical protein [Verrucomicrobiales bacterium]
MTVTGIGSRQRPGDFKTDGAAKAGPVMNLWIVVHRMTFSRAAAGGWITFSEF